MGHFRTSVMLYHHPFGFPHAVAQGHSLGGNVIVPDDGADLGGPEDVECVFHAGAGRFRGVALMPMGVPEQIADLQHFLPVPQLPGHSALAYHLSGLLQHHCPEAVAPFPVPSRLPLQPPVHLLIGERTVVGVHYLLVLQYHAQVRPVRRCHFAQQQPRGFYYCSVSVSHNSAIICMQK